MWIIALISCIVGVGFRCYGTKCRDKKFERVSACKRVIFQESYLIRKSTYKRVRLQVFLFCLICQLVNHHSVRDVTKAFFVLQKHSFSIFSLSPYHYSKDNYPYCILHMDTGHVYVYVYITFLFWKHLSNHSQELNLMALSIISPVFLEILNNFSSSGLGMKCFTQTTVSLDWTQSSVTKRSCRKKCLK